jgi:hypothetical protein
MVQSAMTIRNLSPNEKRRIAEEHRLKEILDHPEKMTTVRVEGETDENGEPIVWEHHIGERQSKDWKRNA